jgi:hypothetical protein
MHGHYNGVMIVRDVRLGADIDSGWRCTEICGRGELFATRWGYGLMETWLIDQKRETRLVPYPNDSISRIASRRSRWKCDGPSWCQREKSNGCD